MDTTLATIEALQQSIEQVGSKLSTLEKGLREQRAEEIAHLVVQLDDGLYLGQARNIVKRIFDEERNQPSRTGLDQRMSGGLWTFMQNFDNLLQWYWDAHKAGLV